MKFNLKSIKIDIISIYITLGLYPTENLLKKKNFILFYFPVKLEKSWKKSKSNHKFTVLHLKHINIYFIYCNTFCFVLIEIDIEIIENRGMMFFLNVLIKLINFMLQNITNYKSKKIERKKKKEIRKCV